MSTKLERVKIKEEQIKALRQKLEAAEKHKERKKEVRRKILLGALMLERLKAGDVRAEALRAELDNYLIKNPDRALFDLPERNKDNSSSLNNRTAYNTAISA
ncbi:MAG: hypothetical protein K2Q33_03725 [Gammaproteobacteria bacterium]|nr:hypothetical protein [Gammaproteobacteria bacterium]